MSDNVPDLKTARLEQELAIEEHEITIEAGRARLAQIERQKRTNAKRLELQNAQLDDEARRIRENEVSLERRIEEVKKNLSTMATKRET